MGHLTSSNRIRYEVLRSALSATISTMFSTPVGLPFTQPVRILKITNLTDSDLYISFNNVDYHDVISANGFCLYDYGSNKADQVGFLEQALGDRIWVRAITAIPTYGGVYVTVVYASDN